MNLLRGRGEDRHGGQSKPLLDVNQAWDDFEQSLFDMIGRVNDMKVEDILDPRSAIAAARESAVAGRGSTFPSAFSLMQMYADEDKIKAHGQGIGQDEAAGTVMRKNAHRNWDWADQFGSPRSPAVHESSGSAARSGWKISPRTGRVAGLRKNPDASEASHSNASKDKPCTLSDRRGQSPYHHQNSSNHRGDFFAEGRGEGFDDHDELESCDSASTVKDRQVHETRAALTDMKRTLSRYGASDIDRKGKSRWEQAMKQGHTLAKAKSQR